jgi:PAS domain S-box-containing protein
LEAPLSQPLKCIWITEPFTRITGFTAGEIELRGWVSLYHSEDRSIAEQHYSTLLSNQSHSFEARILTKNDEVRWVRVHGRPIWDDMQGRVTRVFGAAQDITAQKQLEQQLLQSQKMEALGRLAGGVAHDFNNLLTVILSYSSMLLEDLSPQDTTYQRIDDVLKAGERAAGLTHQLLAFSRKQVLQSRIVNLGATLEEMERMLLRVIGEDIQVVTVIDEGLAQVRIDPGQMQQVILNLIVNARDAMPRGGKLRLELNNVEMYGVQAQEHEIPPGRYVMFTVSDDGIGMTPAVQERIFEPFFSTKEVGRGTGLGLATVYGIIRQSGGNIWLSSEPNIGTTFKVFLPRVDDEPERTIDERISRLIKGDETVLLVEDEPEVRVLVAEILVSAGYKVLTAGNSDEAFSASDRYTGEIHLLVTDVVMPKMSGLEIATHLAALRPEMGVLYMSGYTGDAVADHGIADANVHFLQKPFTPGEFCAKVRAVLNASNSRVVKAG